MASLGHTVVLFGGGVNGSSDLGDTWIWNGAAWTQMSVVGPSPRAWAVMAPLGGRLVLFGGVDDATGTVLGDTWTWDGTKWTQLDVPGPPPRFAAAMAAPYETTPTTAPH
jgi:hypothetical protein